MIKNVDCPYKELSCDFNNCECAKYKAWRKASNPIEIKNKLNELNINFDQDLLSLILTMQKMFISKFHKVDNLTDEDVDIWIDRYLVCIEDEIREAREHLKYYEFNDLNEKEFKKEIIDILHFVANLFIMGKSNIKLISEKYFKLYDNNIIEVKDLINFIYNNVENRTCLYSKEEILKELNDNKDKLFDNNYQSLITADDKTYFNFQGLNYTNILMLILLNNLLDSCGKVRQQINWKFWKSQKKKIDYDKLNECFAEVLLSLITIFKSINCSPEQIKDIYIKKNMENIFRQEFNY